MNVDGAFILAETSRKTSVFLFVDNSMQIFLRYISLQILGRCLSHVSHCHTPLKKKKKHLKMISNGILAQNFLALWFGLWTLAPRARAALFEYMQFVRVFENITFCSLFNNCLRPFHDFNHQSNQQQPPLPLLIGDMRWFYDDHSIILEWCLRLSLSDSFKCLHTADCLLH